MRWRRFTSGMPLIEEEGGRRHMLQSLAKAREHMIIALELLDRSHAPADVGAHLDLAICRLNEELGASKCQARLGERIDQCRLDPRMH